MPGTTVVRIRILIGTTIVRIRILIGTTVVRIASVVFYIIPCQNITFTFATQNDNITPGSPIFLYKCRDIQPLCRFRGQEVANVMIYNMYPEEEIRCVFDKI